MPRIRPIKPSLPKSEKLYDLEKRTGLPIRFAVVGLVLYADREGRFEWRARQIQSDVLPYDECSMEDVLVALVDARTLVRYQVGGEEFGCFANWNEHQRPRGDERASVLPPPPQASDTAPSLHCDEGVTNPSRLSDEPVTDPSRTRRALVTNPSQGSGGPEKGEGGPEKGERSKTRARVHEPATTSGPSSREGMEPRRGRTLDFSKPDLEVLQPSEAQLVMLHGKAQQLGRPLEEIASEHGVPIAGLYVGRLKDHLDELLAQRARARASPPMTFCQMRDENNDQALAEALRRLHGGNHGADENQHGRDWGGDPQSCGDARSRAV